MHRRHWHLDYLRAAATPAGVWWLASPQRLEHAWAGVLIARGGLSVPFPRFGASDCRCRAHLVYAPCRPGFHRIRQELQGAGLLPGTLRATAVAPRGAPEVVTPRRD